MLTICTENAKKLPAALSASRPATRPAAVTEETSSEQLHRLLRQRKSFLKAGLYSSLYKGCRAAKKRTSVGDFKFSLPIHQGAFMMKITTDFELPLDIKEEFELGRVGKDNLSLLRMKKPTFTHIRASMLLLVS